jgi:sporulation and spore germination protein
LPTSRRRSAAGRRCRPIASTSCAATPDSPRRIVAVPFTETARVRGRYVFVTSSRPRLTDRVHRRRPARRERGVAPPRRRIKRALVAGILGAAVLLGLGVATPTAPVDQDSDVRSQSLWDAPVPDFLAPAVGIRGAAPVRGGLVPPAPPRALGVPVADRGDAEATAARRGVPVRVFFSRRPESDSAFASVFPVPRLAPDQAVATAALASLIKGPTAAERADGYYSELGGALTGASTCSGKDFRIALDNGVATVRFCRSVRSGGVGQDARMRAQIEATLRQFRTIGVVRLIGSDGRCLFDPTGQDHCAARPAAPARRS